MADETFHAFDEVVYSERSKKVIQRFMALENKCGSFWDNEDDKDLAFLKKEVKDHYLVAQDYTCAYCRQKIKVKHNAAWDTEHIVHKDGYPSFMFEARNLCVSCKDCNRIKWDSIVLRNKSRIKFPRLSKDYIICHPHFHRYSDHVRVVKAAMLYIPLTDEGRYLIEICGLLRFVYRFAGFKGEATDVAVLLLKLSSELAEAKSSNEQLAIMTLISGLMSRQISKLTGEALDNM